MLLLVSEETSSAESKETMSPAKFASLLWLFKRAKRILANRQSATMPNQQRRMGMRYLAELDRNIQTLQTKTTNLTLQLFLLQQDRDYLIADNNDLSLRVQALEQRMQMQQAYIEVMKEDIRFLRMLVLTRQGMPISGPLMNPPASFGASLQTYPINHAMTPQFTAQQVQHLQINSQLQQSGVLNPSITMLPIYEENATSSALPED